MFELSFENDPWTEDNYNKITIITVFKLQYRELSWKMNLNLFV